MMGIGDDAHLFLWGVPSALIGIENDTHLFYCLFFLNSLC